MARSSLQLLASNSFNETRRKPGREGREGSGRKRFGGAVLQRRLSGSGTSRSSPYLASDRGPATRPLKIPTKIPTSLLGRTKSVESPPHARLKGKRTGVHGAPWRDSP